MKKKGVSCSERERERGRERESTFHSNRVEQRPSFAQKTRLVELGGGVL